MSENMKTFEEIKAQLVLFNEENAEVFSEYKNYENTYKKAKEELLRFGNKFTKEGESGRILASKKFKDRLLELNNNLKEQQLVYEEANTVTSLYRHDFKVTKELIDALDIVIPHFNNLKFDTAIFDHEYTIKKFKLDELREQERDAWQIQYSEKDQVKNIEKEINEYEEQRLHVKWIFIRSRDNLNWAKITYAEILNSRQVLVQQLRQLRK